MINQVGYSASRAFNNFTLPDKYLPVEQPVDKDNHKFGKTIVIPALVIGFGTLALMKGAFPKTLNKYLDKWKLVLQTKSQKGGKFQNIYRFALGRINSFLEKTESINNFTSLKDILFKKLMFGKDGNRTFTRKIHSGITKFFDKLSRKTVNSSYSNTHKKFAGLNEYITSVNEKILRENPSDSAIRQTVSSINKRISTVNENLEKGFGINARNSRLKEMKEASDGLFDYFWNASVSDIRNFRGRNMYQSFIAEDYLLSAKMKLTKETNLLRQIISHDIIDNYKSAIKTINNIQKVLNPSDVTANEILGKLRINLSKYRSLSGANETIQRNAVNNEIIDNLNLLSKEFKVPKYNQETVETISRYINEVKNTISKSSKGELQEILSLYKSILPRKEYLNMKKEIQKTVKSLDESIETETVKYFDKARDLKLGSAPTDVLSIIGTVGTVGWFTAKSKDKDERISASLKYGIPAIGAIATSLYCTARLISGSKSLVLGLISGWVMNQAGSVVDNLRKKYSLDISLQNKNLFKPQPDNV